MKCKKCSKTLDRRNKTGKCLPCFIGDLNRGKIGNKNHNWKGIRATIQAKHTWIYRNYGKSNMCFNINCSHDKPKKFNWANISGKYYRNIDDYIMLCAGCHKRMDMDRIFNNHCHKGHEFTKENSVVRRDGYRQCRICKNYMSMLWKRKYRKNKK